VLTDLYVKQRRTSDGQDKAGYSVSYTKKGELRLDSVSLELEREFSTRRAEIVAAKKDGLHDMAAWRKTRKEKDPKVEKVNVLDGWRARVDQYQAKTIEQNKADVRAEREAWSREASFSIEAQQELSGERGHTEAARWQAAARRATERTATVTANAIITEYMTEVARGEAWAPITYSVAEQRLMAEVSAGRLLATDDGRYTTWDLTRADRECVRDRPAPAALALKPDAAALQVAEGIKASLERGQRGLSEQQAAAAAGILSADRGTVVVQGDAGAGKTTMLRAVHDIAGRNGWETVGLAVQGVAARNLQEESGIASTTVSSYLAKERFLNRVEPGEALTARAARLIVIDEASMLDSRGLAELMSQADKHGDKLVLVGDRNQIQSVGAGRPFDRLVEAAEASGHLHNLSENYRQRNADLRQAVDLARGGQMRESLDVLARTSRVIEIESAELRRCAVAAQYDKNTLILTGTRESRDALNGLIRGDLAARGVIDRTTAMTYKTSLTDADGARRTVTREFAKGDVITFLKNDYRKELDVRNGERGEVLKTSKDGLTVRLEDGRKVEVNMERYSALDHGYATTTYKSQGQTYDKVVVDADTRSPQLQDQRNTYVQITRARDDIRVFTDDLAGLRESAAILNYKTDTFNLDVSLEKAAAMERRVHDEAFGDRARQEAGAKIVQAEAWAAEKAEKLQEAMEEPKTVHAVRNDGLAVAADQAAASTANALRELQEARVAEKAAAEVWQVANKRHNDAKVSLYKAEARVEKTPFWDKPAAQIAEKEARQGLDAAYEKSKEAETALRAAYEKLEKAQTLSRETEARSVEAAHRNSFQGTPEAVAEVVKFDSAVQEAKRELEAARAAEQEARLGRDAERQRYGEAWQEWAFAQSSAQQAGESVRKALPWDKAEARLAEKEAQNGLDAMKEKLAEIKAAQEMASSRVAEAREMVEAAQAKHDAAQTQAAEAVHRNDLQATQEALGARTDFTSAEQQRVAEYLSRDAGADILRGCDNPEQAIAAGSVACGLRTVDEATKGMEQSAVDNVVDLVECQRQAELDRTRQHSRGFGRSL
jgi:hypothetical protein